MRLAAEILLRPLTVSGVSAVCFLPAATLSTSRTLTQHG
jgi:hypothetical protein